MILFTEEGAEVDISSHAAVAYISIIVTLIFGMLCVVLKMLGTKQSKEVCDAIRQACQSRLDEACELRELLLEELEHHSHTGLPKDSEVVRRKIHA